MITIKGNNKDLTLKIGFAKTKTFVSKYLKKDESLLEVLPTCMATSNYEFLSAICYHYQYETQYSNDQVDEIIESYLVSEGNDISTLYGDIIKEFDVNGLIQKGMGFSLVNKINEEMSKVLEMTEDKSK